MNPPKTPTPQRSDGEFEIQTRSHMVCGYCGQTERWRGQSPIPEHLALGYLELTGVWSLGVGPAGELVVLAEATRLNGATEMLPHLCGQIPADLYAKYADEIAAAVADHAIQDGDPR